MSDAVALVANDLVMVSPDGVLESSGELQQMSQNLFIGHLVAPLVVIA